MHHPSFSVLFYLQKSKKNKKGLCPIRCRITYCGERKEFATGEFLKASSWNSSKQKALPDREEKALINHQLQIISVGIKNEYLKLQGEQEDITASLIADRYHGITAPEKKVMVLAYFDKFLRRKEKLVGIDIEYATWKKYRYARLYVEEFIWWKHKKKDFPIKKLKLIFLSDFEYYLKTQRKHAQATVNKTIQRFRGAILRAQEEGILDQDPFRFHKPGRVRREVIFLTSEELDLLEKYRFTQPRLDRVRDLFVFCCYTGLGYREMVSLEAKHLIKGIDGNTWIEIERKKTGKKLSIPLLPRAEAILEKYKDATAKEYLLPGMSNQKLNSYLKEIAGILGIEKRITNHTARKTFATTVLLYNNVPMSVVKELLGHSSIKTTEMYYAKHVKENIIRSIKYHIK